MEEIYWRFYNIKKKKYKGKDECDKMLVYNFFLYFFFQ